MAKGTPGWLVPAIIVTGVIALWAKAASAAPAPSSQRRASTFGTTTVGNRVYAVTRLGQGNYLVALVSTGGVPQATPVTYTFSQDAETGAFGDAAKLAQLRADLHQMDLNFGA